MIADLGGFGIPAIFGVAVLATGAELAPVDIGMAILAAAADIGEAQLLVAEVAGDVLMEST